MTAAPELHPLRASLIKAGILAPGNDRPQPTIDLSGLPAVAAGDPRATRYADAALRSECFIMARTGEGARNDQLNKSAYKLGSLVSAGHLDKARMIDALWTAARTAGLGDKEIGQTLRSGGNAGAAAPRDVRLADQPEPSTVDAPPRLRVATEEDLALDAVSSVDESKPPDSAGRIPPELDWPDTFANASLEPEWLVPDLFERGGNYAVYSPAKAGKSLLMLDIVGALATGRPVLGYPARPREHIVYVDQENSHRDLVQRLTAMGYGPSELDFLHYLSFPRIPPLDTPGGAIALCSAVQHYGATWVVLDTVGRMITGPENDADTWHALYRCTLAPLKGAGVAVTRLDHMGKDSERGMRGSSAKVSDVDAAFRLERTYDGRIHVIRDVTRNGNGPEEIMYEQLSDPLRHVPVGRTDDEISRAVRLLDQLGVPPNGGRDLARDALRTTKIKMSNDTLAKAVQARRLQFRADFGPPKEDEGD